jgi:hypothetical protein
VDASRVVPVEVESWLRNWAFDTCGRPAVPGPVAAMIEEMRELHCGLDLNAPETTRLGYRVARLDIGPRQPHARGLYESEGDVASGNFNSNPVATFFCEKRRSG